MDRFPYNWTPQNYQQDSYSHHMSLIRQEVYNHIMRRHSEADYMAFWVFCRDKLNISKELSKTYINQICQELRDLGWICTTTCSDTCLFVDADQNNRPYNCYVDSEM